MADARSKPSAHRQVAEAIIGSRGNEIWPNVKQYSMNNSKEYFAEATEGYLGGNDFYPSVRAELILYEPRLNKIMEKVRGPVR